VESDKHLVQIQASESLGAGAMEGEVVDLTNHEFGRATKRSLVVDESVERRHVVLSTSVSETFLGLSDLGFHDRF
jgi:hypothetical protein